MITIIIQPNFLFNTWFICHILVFLAADPDHWCKIAALENLTQTSELINFTIPWYVLHNNSIINFHVLCVYMTHKTTHFIFQIMENNFLSFPYLQNEISVVFLAI